MKEEIILSGWIILFRAFSSSFDRTWPLKSCLNDFLHLQPVLYVFEISISKMKR